MLINVNVEVPDGIDECRYCRQRYYELGMGTHPTAIWWIRKEAQNDQRTNP